MKYNIITTEHFDQWLSKLKDKQVVYAINKRLLRVEAGNLGDVKAVGAGVSEMRIFIGKGYRIYFSIRHGKLILLLCGGNKDTQANDIKHAKSINEQVEN